MCGGDAVLGMETVDEGELTADFLSKIIGCIGMVGMKGVSVGSVEVDAVMDDPMVADAISRKSMIFVTSIIVWSCLKIKFSIDLLDFSI